MQDVSTDWSLVEEVLNRLCTACNEGKLVPVLEADIVAYMYYALVDRLGGDASYIHLSTRLYGAEQNDKYDVVIGEVCGTAEQKELLAKRVGERIDAKMKRWLESPSVLKGFRPAVLGKLILEVKVFVEGFDSQQLGEHWNQAINDVRKLGELAKSHPEGRAVVLFDGKRYLTDHRKRSIADARSAEDTNLRIYICEQSDADRIKWELL